MNTNKISVVVPSYNSASTIGYTLDALLRQGSKKEREIIVVDSSDDGKTARLLEGYTDKVCVVRLDRKTMPATARNIGAGMAHGQTLAFLDSDAFPEADWLARIAAARAEGIRVGGGAILVPDFQKKNPLSLAQYFLQFNEFIPSGGVREKRFVPSCNLFCEKALFHAVGGFPAIRASEDVLFGFAAGASSPVIFHPEIRVYHIFRTNLGAYLKNQILLGKYILIYRRGQGGGFLYKAWVAVPLIPVIFLAKFCRILSRVLKNGPAEASAFLSAFPLFLLGLFSWTVGFFEGCFVSVKNYGTR